LWVLGSDLASCHPSGAWNFDVVLDFWKICAPLAERMHVDNLAHQIDDLVRIKLVGESAAIEADMKYLWHERLPVLLEGYEPQDIYTEMRWTSSTIAFQIGCCH
jgi:hypothetical protein